MLVDSEAKESYVELKNESDEQQGETYHFFVGLHFGSNIRDSNSRELSSMDLVDAIAV